MSWGRPGASRGAPGTAVLGVSRGGPGTFVPGGPRDAPGTPQDNLSRRVPGQPVPGGAPGQPVPGDRDSLPGPPRGLPGASQGPPRGLPGASQARRWKKQGLKPKNAIFEQWPRLSPKKGLWSSNEGRSRHRPQSLNPKP